MIEDYPVRKYLAPIDSKHPIVKTWKTTELMAHLIGILNGCLPGWNCMDVVRIGYEDQKTEALPAIL
jgi:ABC-type proline/glycine betaine transport system substrate-binding protein